MKKRRLTSAAVLATLLSSTIAPSVTKAAKVETNQQQDEKSSNTSNEAKIENTLESEVTDINIDKKENDKKADEKEVSQDKDSKQDENESKDTKEETSEVEEASIKEDSTATKESKEDAVKEENKEVKPEVVANSNEKEVVEANQTTNNKLELASEGTTSSSSSNQVKENNSSNSATQNNTQASDKGQNQSSNVNNSQAQGQNNSQNQVSNNQSKPNNTGNNQNNKPVQNNNGQSQVNNQNKPNNNYHKPVQDHSYQRPANNYNSHNSNKVVSPVIPSNAEDLLPSTPIKITSTMTGEEFIKSIGDFAAEVASKNDIYASVMIAQACLETGFGSSTLSQDPYYNFFGIKGAYKGQSVNMQTQEDSSSGMYTISDSFRKYPSPKESFEDYAELMHQDMYKGALKSNTNSYQDATKFLTGRYATDHQYNEKLNAIIEAYDLTKYDNYDGSASKQLEKIKKEEDIFYNIKLGDTLSKIAEEYKTTVEELQKQNKDKVKDVNLIYSGQKLKVGKKVTYEYKYNPNFSLSDDNNVNAKQGDFTLPLKPGSYTVTSPFGNRWGSAHEGIDLATPMNSSVYAAKDGKVAAVGFHPSAGNYVIINHGNNVYTNYFHLSSQAVKVGDTVKAGQLIAHSGNTGNSTGPHLHFGISNQLWSGYSNPTKYLHF